jgi:hypothetical protein
MLILGVILLIVGFLLGIYIIWVIGVILAVVGTVFLILERVGSHRQIGGRRWY